MSDLWLAPPDVQEFFQSVRRSKHSESIDAGITLVFDGGPAYKGDSPNFGSVKRASKLQKLFTANPPEFVVIVSYDYWQDVLVYPEQRIALLSYHLSRVVPEYEPEYETTGKRRKPVKDEHGRIRRTDEVKLTPSGEVVWKLRPVDLVLCVENLQRFGQWFEDASVGEGEEGEGEEEEEEEETDAPYDVPATVVESTDGGDLSAFSDDE